MYTFSHGLWVYIFTRNKRRWWLYVLGGMFPDIIYLIKGLQLILQGFIPNIIDSTQKNRFLSIIFTNLWVDILSNMIHSLFIWLILIIIIYFIKRIWILLPFMWGWLSHILIDLLTHGKDAHPVFWPISSFVFFSPVSYWEPGRLGREFNIVSHGIMLIILGKILFVRIKSKKTKK